MDEHMENNEMPQEQAGEVIDVPETDIPEEDGLTEAEYMAAQAYSDEEKAAAVAAAGGSGWIREVYEWVQAIAIAVVLALVINQFLFSIAQVEGGSMVPTLHGGERLIVSKLFYQPQNGDIVIVKSRGLKKFIVKRVIAVGGQTVDMDARTGDVTVDGKVLNEPYIAEKLHSTGQQTYPLKIEDDSIFVMGDNRNNSTDSRSSIVGQVPKSDVVGKAVFRIWPFNKLGGLYGNARAESGK